MHCAAVGLFRTHVKEKKAPAIDPAIDYRYMLNIISSAIVNTPCVFFITLFAGGRRANEMTSSPPNAVIALVNNRATKTHETLHYAEIDETMVCRPRHAFSSLSIPLINYPSLVDPALHNRHRRNLVE